MNKTLGALAVTGSLLSGNVHADERAFMGEDIQNPNITYWGAGTPMESPEVLAAMGVTCDRVQPIFDKTTGEAFSFIPEDIIQSAGENGDETVVRCEDTEKSDR